MLKLKTTKPRPLIKRIKHIRQSTLNAGHYEIFNAVQNKTEQNSESARLF